MSGTPCVSACVRAVRCSGEEIRVHSSQRMRATFHLFFCLSNKTGNGCTTHNVTLWAVRETIVAVEKQQALHISVRACVRVGGCKGTGARV